MKVENLVELHQKYLNEHRDFRLDPDQIRLFVKDSDGETETFVDYEDLTTTVRSAVEQSGRVLVMAIASGIFGGFGLILYALGVSEAIIWAPPWIIASVLVFAIHFYKRRRYTIVDLTNGQGMLFSGKQANEEDGG
ncbi:MAG: phage holin family protein [Dehalococcoidia bacterium]|nr:phage holin family protein [Dehalococcoidia bacterium]